MSDNNNTADSTEQQEDTGTRRVSSRQRRAPQPLYVPDENIRFDDDESVDSDWDEDEDDIISIRSSDEVSEGDVAAGGGKTREKEEYDMTDGFVVPDNYDSEEEYECSDSEEEEALSTGDEEDDEEDDEELDSDDMDISSDENEELPLSGSDDELDSDDVDLSSDSGGSDNEEDPIAPSS